MTRSLLAVALDRLWSDRPLDEIGWSSVAPVQQVGLGVDGDEVARICRRYGIARLEIFGSVGRGDAGPDSDVDLLYELAPGARLGWEIEEVVGELAAVIGRRVDLVSRRALHERLRERVLAEAQLLYAA